MNVSGYRAASRRWRGGASAGSILAIAVALIAGCDRLGDRLPATQVAAQVNADEITIHQVNALLARTPDVAPDMAPRTKREILDRLIERQLAVQQAQSRRLDRVPDVLWALESARAEILARAFAEEIARGLPKPTPEEVRAYYSEHPELFAQRRVFVLEEVSIVSDPRLSQELRERARMARSIREVSDWLGAQGATYSESRGVRTAEQLPLQTLPRLHVAKDGEVLLFDQGERYLLVRVVTSRSAPVDQSTAAPRIAQYLFNRRANEAVAEEMKRVKQAADIEYRGEFAAAAEAPAAEASVAKGVRGLK